MMLSTIARTAHWAKIMPFFQGFSDASSNLYSAWHWAQFKRPLFRIHVVIHSRWTDPHVPVHGHGWMMEEAGLSERHTQHSVDSVIFFYLKKKNKTMQQITHKVIGTYTIWNDDIPADRIIYAFTYCRNTPSCGYEGHEFYVDNKICTCRCTACKFPRGISADFLKEKQCEVYYVKTLLK